MIDRQGGSGRKSIEGQDSSSSATAIVLGTILDGILESVVLGLTILDGEGLSIAVLVAVFLSNLPDGIDVRLREGWPGRPASRIMMIWLAVVVVSGLSSLLGFFLLGDAHDRHRAGVRGRSDSHDADGYDDAEAFRHGGAVAGLATTVGVRAGIPDRDGRARWIGIDHERTSGRGTQERGRHRAPYPGIGSVPGDARQLGDERPRAYGLIASAGAIAAVP